MLSATRGTVVLYALMTLTIVAAFACGGGVLKKAYEYEEELSLSLDGSATLNVNASVPALVALRGVDLPLDPRVRLDRARVRALFEGRGVDVTRVSLTRRDGRRFVHVSLDVDDVRELPHVLPFAWSTYRLSRRGDVYEYRQVLGAAAGRSVGDVGWTGEELVAFRMHIPSEVPFHNAAPDNPKRGNIVEWEQPLSERLAGRPLELQVHMETESILYSTLILFASTIVAAAGLFAGVVWWVARRGRTADLAHSPMPPVESRG